MYWQKFVIFTLPSSSHNTCGGASIDKICQMGHNMGIWNRNILMLHLGGIHIATFCENHTRSIYCWVCVHADGMSYLWMLQGWVVGIMCILRNHSQRCTVSFKLILYCQWEKIHQSSLWQPAFIVFALFYSLIEVYQYFRGNRCHRNQGRWLPLNSYTMVMEVANVCLSYYIMSCLEDNTVHGGHCENLKSRLFTRLFGKRNKAPKIIYF
jgi:hypothetical protein